MTATSSGTSSRAWDAPRSRSQRRALSRRATADWSTIRSPHSWCGPRSRTGSSRPPSTARPTTKTPSSSGRPCRPCRDSLPLSTTSSNTPPEDCGRPCCSPPDSTLAPTGWAGQPVLGSSRSTNHRWSISKSALYGAESRCEHRAIRRPTRELAGGVARRRFRSRGDDRVAGRGRCPTCRRDRAGAARQHHPALSHRLPLVRVHTCGSSAMNRTGAVGPTARIEQRDHTTERSTAEQPNIQPRDLLAGRRNDLFRKQRHWPRPPSESWPISARRGFRDPADQRLRVRGAQQHHQRALRSAGHGGSVPVRQAYRYLLTSLPPLDVTPSSARYSA